MTKVLLAGFLAVALAAGCGGDDEGTTGSSGGDSTSTGGSSCSTAMQCVNGACSCADGPNAGQSCCDPEDSACEGTSCDELCEVCS